MSVHPHTLAGGGRAYEVRYRDDQGVNRSKRFRGKGAKARAEEFDRDMASRRYRGEVVDPSKDGMTLGEFYEQVFLVTRAASADTRRTWQTRWASKDPAAAKPWHLGAKWGAVRLRDVNRREAVLIWHDAMRRAGAPASTIYRAHDLLCTLISHAVELEYLSRNRIKGLAPSYQPKRAKAPWMPAEIETARNFYLARSITPPLSVARGDDSYRFRRRRDAELVSFMGYQGVRPGEALALAWPRLLDDERRGIAVAVNITDTISLEAEEQTKTRTDRSVRLDEHVRSDLRAWWVYCGRPLRGLVFPRGPAGEAWTQAHFDTWRKAWGKTCSGLGFERVSPKHLRHSCISMWIREGRDVGTVADDAGHTVEVCLKHYRHAFRNLDPAARFHMSAAIAAARQDRGEEDGGLRRVV